MSAVLYKAKNWAKKQASLVAAVSVGVVIGGAGLGVAYASIPDANGVIHGSIRDNGNLRIIDDATQSCTAQQTPINFNQTGSFLSNLSNANFANASLQYRNFAGIDFHGGDFTNAIFAATSFDDSVNFTDGVIASNTNFTGAQFNFTKFNGTNLSTAILTGATWNSVICPDGTNSNNNGNTCIGHLIP